MKITKSITEDKKVITTVEATQLEIDALHPAPRTVFEIQNMFDGFSSSELKQMLLWLLWNLK